MSPLFVPGPVDVDPAVADAQTQPMMPHRSKAFEEIFHRAEGKARRLFGTNFRVFLTASSGTGFHEAAVRNFVPQDGWVLSCSNGAFGDRWYDVAVTNGKQVDRLDAAWGEPLLPDRVGEALGKKPYSSLHLVHNETSTGVMNPVKEIAAVARVVNPEIMICVDAVSSLSGAKIEMDAWGVDMVLTSSQKALALPPGLGLAAVSDRALARAEEVPNRGWYFDLVRLEKHRVKNSTPATPPVSLIYALDVQLDRIFEEGLENRFARHSALASRTHAWAEASGHGLFAHEAYRSQTVTTVCKDESLDIAELNAFLTARDMRIAGGYGPIKPTTFRIGHMGEIQMADLEKLLDAIDEYMAERA